MKKISEKKDHFLISFLQHFKIFFTGYSEGRMHFAVKMDDDQVTCIAVTLRATTAIVSAFAKKLRIFLGESKRIH